MGSQIGCPFSFESLLSHCPYGRVGLSNSSKGLCVGCAADLGVALGCKGRHEGLARGIALSQAKASRVASTLPIFAIVMGAIFSAWGLLSRPLSIFTAVLGIGFAAFGALFLKRGAASRAE